MNSTITYNTYSGLQIDVCLWRSLWYGNLFPHLVQISFEQLILWFCAETSWQRRHRFDPHLFSCAVRNWILSNRLLHFEHCGFGHVLRCVSIDSITFLHKLHTTFVGGLRVCVLIDSITFSHKLHTTPLEGLNVCLSMIFLLRNRVLHRSQKKPSDSIFV